MNLSLSLYIYTYRHIYLHTYTCAALSMSVGLRRPDRAGRVCRRPACIRPATIIIIIIIITTVITSVLLIIISIIIITIIIIITTLIISMLLITFSIIIINSTISMGRSTTDGSASGRVRRSLPFLGGTRCAELGGGWSTQIFSEIFGLPSSLLDDTIIIRANVKTCSG